MRIVAALRCQHTGAIGTRRIYDSWETYRPYPPPTVSSTQLKKTTTHHVVPGMWPMRAVSSPERRYRTWITQQKIEFFGSHPSITGVPYRLIQSLYRSDVARRSNAKEILRWTTSRVFVPFYSCAGVDLTGLWMTISIIYSVTERERGGEKVSFQWTRHQVDYIGKENILLRVIKWR